VAADDEVGSPALLVSPGEWDNGGMTLETFVWGRRARCRYLVLMAGMSTFLIVAAACERTHPRPGPTDTVEPPPVCTSGGLQFAAPYMPTDIALSPDGKLLAVADRGLLAVRDAATLRVHRYLEPRLNGWRRVRFAEAGKVLLAETSDLHAELDTTTWQLRASPKQQDRDMRAWRELDFLREVPFGRSESLLWYNRELWAQVPGAPALGPGVIPTAFELSLIDETGWTAQSQEYDQDLDAQTLEQLRTVVATSAGEIRILDHGGKILSQRPIGASTTITKLQVTGGHLVAGTTLGEVIVLTRELAEVARAQVLQPRDIEDARFAFMQSEDPQHPPESPKPVPPDSFVRLQYDPVEQRIFWLSTSLRLGVFDLKARRSLAELPATRGPGIERVSFLDARTLAALSPGVLWVWNIASGQTKWHAAGPFVDALLTGEPGIVVASENGRLTLYRRDDGEVVRSVCILPDGCDATLRASRQIKLEPAPDRRHVLVFDKSLEYLDHGGEPSASLQVWSADLTERVQSIVIDSCSRPSRPEFVVTADVVRACYQRFHATTFQPLPGVDEYQRLHPEKHTSFPLANGGTLEVTRGAEHGVPETVTIDFGVDGFDVIASDADEAPPPRDAQRLVATQVAVTADGKLFALAGGLEPLDVSGPVQVWCTPVPGQAQLRKASRRSTDD
jgi:hypothetical protein